MRCSVRLIVIALRNPLLTRSMMQRPSPDKFATRFQPTAAAASKLPACSKYCTLQSISRSTNATRINFASLCSSPGLGISRSSEPPIRPVHETHNSPMAPITDTTPNWSSNTDSCTATARDASLHGTCRLICSRLNGC